MRAQQTGSILGDALDPIANGKKMGETNNQMNGKEDRDTRRTNLAFNETLQ